MDTTSGNRISRRTLGQLAALPFAASPGLSQSGAQSSNAQPFTNVVLITSDHMRWNHLAANGNPAIITPNLDRLANAGVSFTHCHTVGVACAPNRASLFTGRYPQCHGLIHNGVKLPETEVTLTHALRESGYYTGQIGKLHFWPHTPRNHREYHPQFGFHQMRLSDEPGEYDDAYGLWLDAQGPEVRRNASAKMPEDRRAFEYGTFAGDEATTHAHWVASETVRFVTENQHKPFFVHAGFYAPHPPQFAPASMLALYRDVRLPPRLYRDDESKFLPPVMAAAVRKNAGVPEEKWTAYRTHFYAQVSEYDRHVGRIIASLDTLGLTDKTLIVVTGDHGDYLGDHNMIDKSDIPYDPAMRVPLVFRGPGLPRGVKSDALAELTDVMPTILSLLNLPMTKGNQGKSLAPAMHGEPGRDDVYMECRENRVLRTRSAKYAYWGNGQEVLFDLDRDPNEFRNVAEEKSAKPLLDEMRMRMMRKSLEVLNPLPPKVARY